jgi:hypothetical protein
MLLSLLDIFIPEGDLETRVTFDSSLPKCGHSSGKITDGDAIGKPFLSTVINRKNLLGIRFLDSNDNSIPTSSFQCENFLHNGEEILAVSWNIEITKFTISYIRKDTSIKLKDGRRITLSRMMN